MLLGNSTASLNLVLDTFPFYYSPRPQLLPFISDSSLSLAAPIVAYWSYSLFFHFLDLTQWSWLQKYRLHEPPEVQARNKVTIPEVVRAVILQQVIQTLVGVMWLDSSNSESDVDHKAAALALYTPLENFLRTILGRHLSNVLLARRGAELVWHLYWYIIPAAQFALAMLIMDTWQYFMHRLFHTNRFLYRNFHSVHHRLYVPYAFGALYNHWLEGLLLDTIGAGLSHSLSLMTVRQAIALFTFSTLKTVDDHSGYSLPFDPFQLLFPNHASYHDVHHQAWGIKYNFSQPFYIHWDYIMGSSWPSTSKAPLERKHS